MSGAISAPLSDAECIEALEAVATHRSTKGAAQALGISRHAILRRQRTAKDRGLDVDPAIRTAMDAIGSKMVPDLAWIKTDPAGNLSYSLRMKTPTGEVSLADMVRESLDGYTPLDEKLFAPRVNTGAAGEHLLVVDLADVHFGKLCVTSETNYEYNIEAARHRTIEGTRALLQASSGIGVARILFVMGNDISHTEDGRSTTSGTPQDADGTWFTATKAAQHASIDAIGLCAAHAPVDLLHCMSNHDWRTGWLLSQAIAAGMGGHSNVRATDYNMSERHRKYYGYENNALLLTHGDGSKEEKIAGHFLQEARGLASSCTNLYALLHHVHHKISKRRGVDVFQSEKDHNGMTAIVTGAPRPEGTHVGVEYVRSPSPPDSWHDRQGYLNKQAVECFAYHPHDGQTCRFTKWY